MLLAELVEELLQHPPTCPVLVRIRMDEYDKPLYEFRDVDIEAVLRVIDGIVVLQLDE